MTGLLWQRTRTTRLNKLGLLDYLPMVGAAFLIAGLAIVGMPGTPDLMAYILFWRQPFRVLVPLLLLQQRWVILWQRFIDALQRTLGAAN